MGAEPRGNEAGNPATSISQLLESRASALIQQQQAALRAQAGLEPPKPMEIRPLVVSSKAQEGVGLARERAHQQGTTPPPLKPSVTWPKGQRNESLQLPSILQHDSNQLVTKPIRQINQNPTGIQQSSAPAPAVFHSNAPSSAWQPEMCGTQDMHGSCSQLHWAAGGSLTGPGLASSPVSVSHDACLINEAAVTAFPMRDGEEALLADLLSTPTSIDWLEDLLAEEPKPEPSLMALAVAQSQPAAEAFPVTESYSADPWEAFATNSQCQQQAPTAMPASTSCNQATQPLGYMASLLSNERLAPDEACPVSNLDDLLGDLPSVLDAPGAAGIHGSRQLAGMHRFDDAPGDAGSWQEEFLPDQAQADPDLVPDCYTGPSNDSFPPFQAAVLDDTTSRQAATGFSILASHELSSQPVPISCGFDSSWDETWPAHFQEEGISRTSDRLGLPARCGDSSLQMFHRPTVRQMVGLQTSADCQQPSAFEGNVSSLTAPQERSRKWSDADAARPPRGMQQQSYGNPAFSTLRDRLEEGLLAAEVSADDNACGQLLSEDPASNHACPPHKRLRQSSPNTGVASSACLQANPTSDFSSSGMAGIVDQCRVDAQATASGSDGQSAGNEAMFASQDGTPIRLMIPEHERHLAEMLHTLAQPLPGNCSCHMTERLPILKEVNRLRGIAAQSPRFKAMYNRNIEALVPQHRWIQLNAALAPTTMSDPSGTLSRWFQGKLETGARTKLPCTDRSGPLLASELVGVPMPTWCLLGMHELARAKNAKHFSRRPGDAASQTALQSVASFLVSCFTVAAISEDNAEAVLGLAGCTFDLSGHVESDASLNGDKPGMPMDTIKLTRKQQLRAKAVWRQYCKELAESEKHRQYILYKIESSGLGPYMQQGMDMGKISQNTSILELAAALAENTAIQQEIILNSHRRFHLEVCSPECIADFYIAAYPGCPDKTQMLRLAAEAA